MSRVDRVIYIPFIHSRHNATDRSLGVGRDKPNYSTVELSCVGGVYAPVGCRES